ncbi:MAG: response regulator [Deltaproteobacteria bacterium]|nr:response regulator [Deltaproteobacteria bacterium]TLN00621.1 MAG: response regulator [bacterium]
MSIPVTECTKTILVVEDDGSLRNYLKFVLEKASYRVILAEDGEDGVRKFKEHRDISLVLTDVQMPRKNGKELFDEMTVIRTGTKVIFMSGDTGNLIDWFAKERLTFISKPFNSMDILGKVQEVLDNHSEDF